MSNAQFRSLIQEIWAENPGLAYAQVVELAAKKREALEGTPKEDPVIMATASCHERNGRWCCTSTGPR